MLEIEKIIIERLVVRNGELEQEGLLFMPVAGDKEVPLVVQIHGFNTFGAWELIFQSRRLVDKGFAVLLVSQLGFGGSKGPRDYCGPLTVSMVAELVQETLNNRSFKSVGVWGFSRGAIVASILLVKYPALFQAGILQSGVYDFAKDANNKDKPSDILENVISETGGTPEAYAERSSIINMEQLQCPVLIIHGENDEIISSDQARMLSERLSAVGKEHTLIIVPKSGHHLSGPAHFKERILPFLLKNL